MLAAESTSRQALERFQELLARWGLVGNASDEPDLHVRDPANARVWRAYDSDQPVPFVELREA